MRDAGLGALDVASSAIVSGNRETTTRAVGASRSIARRRAALLKCLTPRASTQVARTLFSAGASGTVWLEVIALRAPFVLYVDPDAVRLREDVTADLAAACTLCRTREAFDSAPDALAAGREPPVDDAAVDRFLARYVLHAGRPLAAASRALAGVAQADSSTDQRSLGRK